MLTCFKCCLNVVFFLFFMAAASELADTEPQDNVEVDESLFQDLDDLQIG